MSRGVQVIRQWYLLRLLARPAGATLSELASSLPDDYPKGERTLRRDLEALQAAGFPLYTERDGRYVRWRFPDGYRLETGLPVTATELMALHFSRDLLAPLQGTPFYEDLHRLLQKVHAVLPPEARAHVEAVRDGLSVAVGPVKNYARHRETVAALQQAIQQRCRVRLRYRDLTHGRITVRLVDPYRLWYAKGTLYLIAHCHKRDALRFFAVDRIQRLTPTDQPFQMPLDMDFAELMNDRLGVMDGEVQEVLLRFEPAAGRYIQERVWHSSQRLEQHPDGRVTLALRVAVTPELRAWVLSFGSNATVLAPERLREEVRREAERMARLYTGRGR